MGRTVLIVEPFERTRDWYKERLIEAGYEVVTSADIAGGVAAATAEGNCLDAVICYLGFPGCSGLAICDELGRLNVPIVFISSGQDEVTEKFFREEGVISFDKRDWESVISYLDRKLSDP